jgi:hypothetical protein
MSSADDNTTWEPVSPATGHGKLNVGQLNALPESAFAFPRPRKEPITDASHVRSALARFDQVTDVDDAERDLAFRNIRKAAKHYHVAMHETDWRQLGT